MLDETADRLAIKLVRKSSEFYKLEEEDQNLLLYYLTKKPKRIKSWIDFLTADYQKNKTINVNFSKLYDEIIDLTLSH